MRRNKVLFFQKDTEKHILIILNDQQQQTHYKHLLSTIQASHMQNELCAFGSSNTSNIFHQCIQMIDLELNPTTDYRRPSLFGWQ